MEMPVTTAAGLGILFAFSLFMATNSNNTALAGPFDDCSKGDLVKQHACLICRTISTHDDDGLKKLLPSPYVNINDRSVCLFLGTAITSNNESAFRILVDNGADPNVVVTSGKLKI